jgi:hypothetical protein
MLMSSGYPESNYNKISFNGTIKVNEEFNGDIDFSIEASRCSLDMKTCEKYSALIIREMCKKLKDKKAFYYSALEQISPPFQCPFKAGIYTIAPLSIDLSLLSLFSYLDGYVWVVTFRLVLYDSESKTKKTIFCINSETKITKTRIKS